MLTLLHEYVSTTRRAAKGAQVVEPQDRIRCVQALNIACHKLQNLDVNVGTVVMVVVVVVVAVVVRTPVLSGAWLPYDQNK